MSLEEDFGNLLKRHYFIRVGLVDDSAVLRMVPHKDFVIHDQEGKVLHTGKADTPLRFSVRNAAPLKTVFYYELASFPDSRRGDAETFYKEAKRKLPEEARLIRDPREDRTPFPDGTMPPPAPWLVVAGPWDSQDEARDKSRKIGNHYQTRIFRTLSGPSTTVVQVKDASGAILASATGYLGVRCENLSDLIRAGEVSSADAVWHAKKQWAQMNAYRGLMEAWANKEGRLTLVNRVFLEDYLYGVVPAEIGNSAPFEMKKTQAVISRSVAIAKLRTNLHNTWRYDLCDKTHCQVYKGALNEHPETNAAVDASWGRVCVYDNQVISAVYSVCCGGATADSADVWGGERPYLKMTIDALDYGKAPDFSLYENAEKWVSTRPKVLCNSDAGDFPEYLSKNFRWTRTHSAAQLLARLNATHKDVKEVRNIRIVNRTSSGLISRVALDTHPVGTIILNGESEIRRALGLPSSFFTLHRNFETDGHLKHVLIKGAGSGHHVGLCQMGAMRLAQMGHDYIFILKHYYQGIEVYRIYE